MKIKKGDIVKVISGKDKGKTGKVLQSFPSLGRVSVEGINILHKHIKKQGTKSGQKIEFPSPIQISNIMLLCPRCGRITKPSFKISVDKKLKHRICRKCKEVI